MNASSLHVTSVGFTAAMPLDRADGLVGWVTVELADTIVIDGVAVRRTRNGHLALSFPTKQDRSGRRRAIVRLTETARAHVEAQVIEQLQRQRRLAS